MTVVWAAVMCLAGALQAAPFDAPPPWEALRGFLSPNIPPGPPRVRVYGTADLRPLPHEGQWWPQEAPHRRPPRPSSWFQHGHFTDRTARHAVDKRQEKLLSTMEELPGDHEAEMVKRAISLWVTLHPLTPVPSGRPPVSPDHLPTNGRRPYGQRLRWGR